MSEPQGEWGRGGRSLRWRLWMLAGGALIGGFGAAIIWRPQVLIYTIGGACVLVGALLASSAFLARGPE